MLLSRGVYTVSMEAGTFVELVLQAYVLVVTIHHRSIKVFHCMSDLVFVCAGAYVLFHGLVFYVRYFVRTLLVHC